MASRVLLGRGWVGPLVVGAAAAAAALDYWLAPELQQERGVPLPRGRVPRSDRGPGAPDQRAQAANTSCALGFFLGRRASFGKFGLALRHVFLANGGANNRKHIQH